MSNTPNAFNPQSTGPRVRDLGISPGTMQPGALNAITDVPGVRVGHRTIIEGDSIRTGVTAILPHEGNVYQDKVVASAYVGNGFGKAAGLAQIVEIGTIETPIILTNTLAVGTAIESVVRWTLAQKGNEQVVSVNALVGECNDSYLNDIRSMRIKIDDVMAAIAAAMSSDGGETAEGAVGAGTGTRCFGCKGGIGTASRVWSQDDGGYVLGALLQCNFGGELRVDGKRMEVGQAREAASGSCMIVLATNAPVDSRQLRRIAKRGILGLARTGSVMEHGSGDFIVAFTTAHRVAHSPPSRTGTVEVLHDQHLTPLFQAAVETVEEGVYNSLTRATTMTGHKGRIVHTIPLEQLHRPQV